MTAVDPAALRPSGGGDHFAVFTPYFRHWIDDHRRAFPHPPISRHQPCPPTSYRPLPNSVENPAPRKCTSAAQPPDESCCTSRSLALCATATGSATRSTPTPPPTCRPICIRTLDPLRQAARFDPDGDHVRRWIPELPGAAIHRPWRHGVDLARYPAPIAECAGM
ncbi:FAD-binding domain-containing protein [Nocardia cyriacigeorgica]|uniref:FAD-binding domain-containing protein n=1 Tax=Nocardia cyriacigeorgica TaxID=135487 RepID=UPI002B4B17F9|nr:FAD-binding domain-containing protein [Nocardia cyriacigeorgica]